jgi:hypothetical protein
VRMLSSQSAWLGQQRKVVVSGCVVVIPLRSLITIHNGPCHQFTERRFATSLGMSAEARAPNRPVT